MKIQFFDLIGVTLLVIVAIFITVFLKSEAFAVDTKIIRVSSAAFSKNKALYLTNVLVSASILVFSSLSLPPKEEYEIYMEAS